MENERMSEVPCTVVDAFTDRPFSGNPAAVCLLGAPAELEWMQAVAAEINLSETAFVCRRGEVFDLRWFTPTVEVELCGHATLASAHVLWAGAVVDRSAAILTCTRDGDWIALDFPVTPAREAPPLPGLLEALDVAPTFVGLADNGNYLVVVDEAMVRDIAPDFFALRATGVAGVIVTAEASEERFDFVSRYFAPNAGIDEDPVTGSAHCCLGPYWSARLGKSVLTGFQASARGGVVRVDVGVDRVMLRGKAVTVLSGALSAAAGAPLCR
jgi:predicted PhzF superfamily epimerase YddE/YHI9